MTTEEVINQLTTDYLEHTCLPQQQQLMEEDYAGVMYNLAVSKKYEDLNFVVKAQVYRVLCIRLNLLFWRGA